MNIPVAHGMPLSPSLQEMLKCLEDRDFPTEKASPEALKSSEATDSFDKFPTI
jgi:hypothetical protein